jgi:hypothetical protein
MGRADFERIIVYRAAAASFLLAAIGVAVPAGAVTGGAPPLGAPATVQNGLIATATGEILYDSNILRVSDSAPLPVGRFREDVRYSPSGSLKFDRNTGRLTVTAEGLIGHDFFQNNRYLDRNHYSGDGALTYHIGSSCQAVVNGSYSSRQAGIYSGSIAAGNPTGNPDSVGAVIDNVQDTAIYGANARCGSPSGRLSFGGGYTRSTLRNAALTRRFSDRNSDTFSGDVGVGILRPGQVSLTGSYSTIGCPGRAVGIPGIVIPPAAPSAGVHTYRVGVTLTRPIGTRLSGTFGISYLHADPTLGQAPYSAPAYNVALYYDSGSRLSFGLTGLRGVFSSSTAGALYRVVDRAQFSAQYDLGQAITIGADIGLIRNDFKQAFALVGEPLRRNELSKTAGVNVTYQPRRLYDVSLGVIQTIRTADPSIYNYNSTKVSLTLAIHI